ncbi:hypothetical protein [Vibrio gallaecicus]|uniref:Uncharacterized protein n=1 Tax=Vibrio gallaecicus TaxID=552386 RepID=A0ABV4N966_9VIBR
MKNCTIVNCGSAFGLGGDVNLKIDGLNIDNCGTVYDIDSESSNINTHAKNVNVTNTETYIRVAGKPTEQSSNSEQMEIPHTAIPLVSSDDNYAMRIALKYIGATS